MTQENTMTQRATLDPTPNTASDAIKAIYSQVREVVGLVADDLTSSRGFDEDDHVIAMLDGLTDKVATLATEQLGCTPDALYAVTARYDDGSPVRVHVDVSTGYGYDLWPRLNTIDDASTLAAATIRDAYPAAA